MPTPLRPCSPARRAGPWVATCWLLLALPAVAQESAPARSPEPPAPAVSGASDAPGQTRFEPTRRRAGSRFAAELRDAEREHAAALAGLREQLAAAPRAERPALQRRIEALKRTREARVLGLQLGEARRQGRAPLAMKLEQRLARLSAAGVVMPASPAGGER